VRPESGYRLSGIISQQQVREGQQQIDAAVQSVDRLSQEIEQSAKSIQQLERDSNAIPTGLQHRLPGT